ncbi:probable Serine/threonine-protein phosphatase T [Saccharomycodes ludwigii]|uniref:Serine/threonine-protein phosphatase n=1 Tax=Saccharomycodes ludwigii TaxID=36035 RepID=A0A376B9V0_9ASCO|nr:probable Serine/threonine-protein phosphatase T [Saccharomycodes ludwigii]
MEKLSPEQQKAALEYKEKGNECFKKKQYHPAVSFYDLAIKSDPTQSIFYSNAAFCHLKLEAYQLALNNCDKAISIDNRNVKAYYRRALSYIGLMEYSKAKKDFKIVLKFKPKDDAALRGVALVDRMIFQANFEKALGADDDNGDSNSNGMRRLCETVLLSSFDGNSDITNYNGQELVLEHVTPENGGEYGNIEVTNMSQEFISFMVNELFLKGKKIPKKYAAGIISHVDSIVRKEPTLLEISNADNPEVKITVVGDTHGQFYDVLNLFHKFGKVKQNHIYIFNGDFVDRGSWSCEVALLLYCLKILYPEHIYIIRGNHETDNMNKVYGFEDECKFKYSTRIFEMFSESFESLPLCCVINQNYIVMHGGLGHDPEVTLDDIRKINRFKQPPREGIFMELLWSDPRALDGLGPSQRGLGYAFGPDITAAFLKKNGLRKVFRSHEVRSGGVSYEHKNKLITIFSAPNYCDSENNLGGVIHVVPGRGSTEPVKCVSDEKTFMPFGETTSGVICNDDADLAVEVFKAVKHPDLKPMAYCKNGGLGF